MPRSVVLRHDLPDGSHHYDWLLDPGDPGADPDARVLVAWRIAAEPGGWAGGVVAAERLPLHRRLYLDHEGEVGGGRGTVRRVRSGEGRILENRAGVFEAEVSFGAGSLRVRGVAGAGGVWSLHFTSE